MAIDALTRPRERAPSGPSGGGPLGHIGRILLGVFAVTAVVAAVLFATRGHSHKVASTPPTVATSIPAAVGPAASTATTTAQQATTAVIIADYRVAFRIFLDDASAYPANPLDPRLVQHMSGPELRTVQNYLTVLRIQGQHTVGTFDQRPVIAAFNGTTATITDCVFDHTSTVNGRTGQTIKAADTATTLNTITMLFESGTWKVSDNQRVGTGCVQAA